MSFLKLVDKVDISNIINENDEVYKAVFEKAGLIVLSEDETEDRLLKLTPSAVLYI